ncbi:MAG: LysM peptidoglycan-binding domain-containing protein [Burkholderiaceae bacterium]
MVEVTPPPVEKAPEGPAPGSPAARAHAQQLLKQAAESLNSGTEDRAREEIAQALALDPTSKTGLCLQKGMNADPVTTLGRDSTPYIVRSGDTLGLIAQRALGDNCEFYLLARYNQIAVPRQLNAGQVLKIPGKVALTSQDKPAAATAATADVKPASTAPTAPAAGGSTSNFTEGRSQMRTAEVRAQVERYQHDAQAAFRRQDLASAIKNWDKVLELEPTNELARARRQEALDLQRRLKEIK